MEKFLSKNCPGWESLVKDRENWPLIEKIRPPEGFCELCKALIDVAGAGLAVRWFNSDVEEYRKAARWWLEEVTSTLTPKIWKEFSDEVKEYVINHVFEHWQDKIFDIYRNIALAIEQLEHEKHTSNRPTIPLILPPIGYIPPVRILRLRAVIQMANDMKFLKIVEYMIKEVKEIYEKSFITHSTARLPYFPTRDERKLIARVMDKFRENGYKLSALPQIYLSLEPPPLFIVYPELEKEEANDRSSEQEEARIPLNSEKRRFDTNSIEEKANERSPEQEEVTNSTKQRKEKI